ncbi:MAG: protein kinase [Candidatus Obscuribacterales bacterium]
MEATKPITIFLAEDHLISRMGLKMLLERTEEFSVVGEADDGEAALSQILSLKPNVVMMDLGLPKVDGIEVTKRVKAELPETRILIFTTADDDKSIFNALEAGADGYCLKNISAELLKIAVNSVLQGAAWLDPAIAQKVLRAQGSSGGNASGPPASAPEKKEPEPSPDPEVPPRTPRGLTESKIHLLSLVEQGKYYVDISKELNLNDSLVKGLLRELMAQLKEQQSSRSPAPGAIPADQTGEQGRSQKLKVGDLVGAHYKIEKLLGFGGMGRVYQARHAHIDRTVAIKTLHEHLASDPSTLERFKLEAEATSSLHHPNLATVYDFGLIGDRVPYIVMEFLDGTSLERVLERRGRIEPDRATRIFVQVASALAEVHKSGIIHRDLKPSNIMLIRKGENAQFVKLVDFGIAKVLEEARATDLTLAGEALGSPPYMSPEQCRGMTLDFRSDLYALGCLMYETYTGYKAILADTPMETLMKHVKEVPSRIPFEKSSPRVGKAVEDIIFALLEKAPENRPGSAEEVKNLLSRTVS